MGVVVPSDKVQYIRQASNGTGIGFQIVACQVNMESGFQTYVTSPTGAQGPYQFEPGTWASYGHGSPFNWGDATQAYINYMNELASIEHNDIWRMLAAYNAGPGNLAAGGGYATSILNCAGAGSVQIRQVPSTSQSFIDHPAAAGSSDDWSQGIRNSKQQVFFAGTNMLSAADAITRI